MLIYSSSSLGFVADITNVSPLTVFYDNEGFDVPRRNRDVSRFAKIGIRPGTSCRDLCLSFGPQPGKAKTMFVLKFTGCAAAAAVAAFLSVGATKAALYPAMHDGALSIQQDSRAQHGDKAVGPRVADEDCHSKTVEKENREGDTKTKTTTKCD